MQRETTHHHNNTVTNLLREGVNVDTIRAWLGHEAINVQAEAGPDMGAKGIGICELKQLPEIKRWMSIPTSSFSLNSAPMQVPAAHRVHKGERPHTTTSTLRRRVPKPCGAATKAAALSLLLFQSSCRRAKGA